MGWVVVIVAWAVAFTVVARTVYRIQESAALNSKQKSRRKAILVIAAVLLLLGGLLGNDFYNGYVVNLFYGALRTIGMAGGIFLWAVFAPERKARMEESL